MKKKMHEPKYENGIQKPGKLSGFLIKFLIFMDAFLFIMLILGIMAKKKELILVSGGLMFFIFVIIIFLNKAYNTSYQENNDFFIIKLKDKIHQVNYSDICDWKPTYNEISILDKTKDNGKFIRVNIIFFKPEILLRKVADMTFSEKFKRKDPHSEDPKREREIVNFLRNTNYGYLIEDYIKKLGNDTKQP